MADHTVPAGAHCPITSATDSPKRLSTPAAPPEGSGIKFYNGRWRWEYTGTRAALLAAGVVPLGVPFPGDRPGRPRCGFVTPEGRAASITKAPRGAFNVNIRPTPAEVKWRTARDEMNVAISEARELEASVGSKKSTLPTSHKQFRKRAAEFLWLAFGMFRQVYLKDGADGSGYSFDASTEEEFESAATSLYWLIHKGGTVFSQPCRDKKITEAWLKSARLDLPLQELLKQAAASQQMAQDERDV